MLDSQSIYTNIANQLSQGQQYPHIISFPVIRQIQNQFYLAVYEFFYNEESIRSGLAGRPTVWALADLENGNILYVYDTRQNGGEFSDASYNAGYSFQTGRDQFANEYFVQAFGILDEVRQTLLTTHQINDVRYSQYLTMILSATARDYQRFYLDLSIRVPGVYTQTAEERPQTMQPTQQPVQQRPSYQEDSVPAQSRPTAPQSDQTYNRRTEPAQHEDNNGPSFGGRNPFAGGSIDNVQDPYKSTERFNDNNQNNNDNNNNGYRPANNDSQFNRPNPFAGEQIYGQENRPQSDDNVIDENDNGKKVNLFDFVDRMDKEDAEIEAAENAAEESTSENEEDVNNDTASNGITSVENDDNAETDGNNQANTKDITEDTPKGEELSNKEADKKNDLSEQAINAAREALFNTSARKKEQIAGQEDSKNKADVSGDEDDTVGVASKYENLPDQVAATIRAAMFQDEDQDDDDDVDLSELIAKESRANKAEATAEEDHAAQEESAAAADKTSVESESPVSEDADTEQSKTETVEDTLEGKEPVQTINVSDEKSAEIEKPATEDTIKEDPAEADGDTSENKSKDEIEDSTFEDHTNTEETSDQDEDKTDEKDDNASDHNTVEDTTIKNNIPRRGLRWRASRTSTPGKIGFRQSFNS